jgi:hypothetical protein
VKKTKGCSDLVEQLELVLGEQLPDRELEALTAHAEGCERCRELLEACRGEQGLEHTGGLVDGVLARTSGNACSRVHSMLCDHVDRKLQRADATLVQEHLNYCSGCAQLASVLEELVVELPQMASLDPGPFFASSVVTATRSTQQPDKWTLLLSYLSRVFQRPRFSLEAAYVGALLIFLVFGGAPVRSVEGVASTTLAGFQLNLSKFAQNTPAVLSESWADFYNSCENRVEGKVQATQEALGSAVETIQGSAEQLRDMSDEHLLKPTAALIQDVTEKYKEYSRRFSSADASEERSEETAE